MNKSIGLLSILMMTSVANGTLFISVNGTLDSHIYMNPGEYAAIGVFGDGGTPSNTRLFLFTVGPCSLDAAQAQIFYPGDLSRVEAGLIPDDYERIADAGYSYPGSVVFIELADSSVPPPPLYWLTGSIFTRVVWLMSPFTSRTIRTRPSVMTLCSSTFLSR